MNQIHMPSRVRSDRSVQDSPDRPLASAAIYNEPSGPSRETEGRNESPAVPVANDRNRFDGAPAASGCQITR